MNQEEFLNKYEFGSTPVIIQGVTKDKQWDGTKNWTIKKLLDKFGNSKFRVANTSDGYPLSIVFKQYVKYILYGRDDSPLYLFEADLENHPDAHIMQRDYKPPKYFQSNLFALVKEDDMPPHRWFMVGPKRSGTKIHQDPLGTSAWNTLI